MEEDEKGILYDILVQSADYQVQLEDQRIEPTSDTKVQDVSSLDLLAFAYGDPSDSEDDTIQHGISASAGESDLTDISLASSHAVQLQSVHGVLSSNYSTLTKVQRNDSEHFGCSLQDNMGDPKPMEPHGLVGTNRNPKRSSTIITPMGVLDSAELCHKEFDGRCATCTGTSKVQCDVMMDRARKNPNIPFIQRSDKDSSRMHIFCLEHAIEVEKQLSQIGGVHIMLLCHPEYPKVEGQAKSLADELGINHFWNDIPFREPSATDKENIRVALEDEEAIPGNGDWAVKLGINLYYSASLCKSPLYSKQMPYNSVLYKAFGRNILQDSPTKPKVSERRLGRQKKIVVAGKWCGKVWMSNQVHPYLAHGDTQEQEPMKDFCIQGADSRLELDSNNSEAAQEMVIATTLKKLGKKRRRTIERVGQNKPKRPFQLHDNVEVRGETPEKPSPHCERILRSGRMKNDTPPLHNDCVNGNHGNLNVRDEIEGGPSTRLRERPPKHKEVKLKPEEGMPKPRVERQARKKAKKAAANSDVTVKDEEAEYQCDVEGCSMGFRTKQDLALHKRNVCPVKGCGKKFFSHKYLVQHRRVHMDERPLKCPWKGCRMSFKWAWARTEHIRVHTGARPYVCKEPGCGQTFRFVSDFSRHKRKTGHSVKKKGKG